MFCSVKKKCNKLGIYILDFESRMVLNRVMNLGILLVVIHVVGHLFTD